MRWILSAAALAIILPLLASYRERPTRPWWL